MQIVPRGPEYLVQERQRTSRSGLSAQTPHELHFTLTHPLDSTGLEGWGAEQLVPSTTHPHDLLLVRGHHVLPQHLLHHMLPLGGLRHVGSSSGRVREAETVSFFS